MKKTLLFIIIATFLTSCYDEYRVDYEHSTVAFSAVTGGSNEPGVLWRTVVKDEGLKLDAGIYLAGILENTEERWADFDIDESLLAGTSYTLLPASYYTLSNDSRFVIPSGSLIGRLGITLDSVQFLNDPLTTAPTYAIPFRLIATSEDSILDTYKTQIFVIKYMNHYEGNYDQIGSFSTVGPDGEVLNSGDIENVLGAKTVQLDSLETNGSMYLTGEKYKMKLNVNADNSVAIQYSPSTGVEAPVNVALNSTPSTSYVSDWENINGINDGYQPTNSGDKGSAAYGNWPNPKTWNFVEYELPGLYYIDQSDVYWWTDGGGILIPFNSYAEYWDVENEVWVELGNPEVNGVAISEADYGNTDTLVFNDATPAAGNVADQWNITKFDRIATTKIRLHFIATESQGILEWQVWGNAVPVSLEMRPIESITPIGVNSYDKETFTMTLNYRVEYLFEDYHTDVTSTSIWRNRVRDGVNEWRRPE